MTRALSIRSGGLGPASSAESAPGALGHPRGRCPSNSGAQASARLELDECEREVRGSLVYRAFYRIDGERVPDAKTLVCLAHLLDEPVLKDLFAQLVALGKRDGPVGRAGRDRQRLARPGPSRTMTIEPHRLTQTAGDLMRAEQGPLEFRNRDRSTRDGPPDDDPAATDTSGLIP